MFTLNLNFSPITLNSKRLAPYLDYSDKRFYKLTNVFKFYLHEQSNKCDALNEKDKVIVLKLTITTRSLNKIICIHVLLLDFSA